MSADELVRDVGTLLWLGFHGTEAPSHLLDAITGGRAGGVILFSRNLVQREGQVDVAALAELVRRLHDADPALLVSIDHEGGRVQRVRAPATVWPPMLGFDRLPPDRADELAYQVGAAMGRELAALGIDIDFAPVLDVHTNPANPIIGDRAFGTEPQAVARRALAFARGLQEAGVLPCGKHFPGHGDTRTDSHLELPRLDHDLDRLRSIELAPFRQAAAAGIPLIMTAHVVFAALDDQRPATLSRKVLHDLLRGELGFQGVVVSDDLDMKAIADHHRPGEAAVAAVEAGCDALLLCADSDSQQAAFEALVAAGQARAETRARIAEAAGRIRRLRRPRPKAAAELASVLGAPDHQRLAAELAGG